jgi:hypothetical protein
MEFQGRVKKILPLRSGVSQRTGNEWKSLPFIFEYHEHETDRYADSVVLETFDTNVIDNLKEGMEVICGFGHKAKPIAKQDGTQATINEIRLYKIESIKGAQAAQQAPQGANTSAAVQQPTPPFPEPQNPSNQADDDDLPF